MEHIEDKLKNYDNVKKEFTDAITNYIKENGKDEYINNFINKHFPEYNKLVIDELMF